MLGKYGWFLILNSRGQNNPFIWAPPVENSVDFNSSSNSKSSLNMFIELLVEFHRPHGGSFFTIYYSPSYYILLPFFISFTTLMFTMRWWYIVSTSFECWSLHRDLFEENGSRTTRAVQHLTLKLLQKKVRLNFWKSLVSNNQLETIRSRVAGQMKKAGASLIIVNDVKFKNYVW